MNKKLSYKGFTLIELLVVISIIGLLSTMTVYAVNVARSKARDTRRLADIKQIQKALDLYYLEHNTYPVSGNCAGTVQNSGWCNSAQSYLSGHWIRNGTTVNLGEFLNTDPIDPLQTTTAKWWPAGGGTYYYFSLGYGGSGKWYMMVFGLENGGHPIEKEAGVTACNDTFFNYGASHTDGIVTVGRDCQE
jgi:prepilin-type N-terminal cleavage/methylation domain-containing protein